MGIRTPSVPVSRTSERRRNTWRTEDVAEGMVTVEPNSLERVLGAIDLRVGVARRARLQPGGLLPLTPGSATLVYVAEGTVRGHPPLDSGCRLDVDRASHQIAMDTAGARTLLNPGCAFLAMGRRPLALVTDSGATLIVFDLELADSVPNLDTVLPEDILVTGFDLMEPAAAALAQSMGPVDEHACPERQGDPLICRIMATTVLLSEIRAWTAAGCAPEGWPVSKDPFLDRVVEAIHDAPGQEWTVERLASVGAMSRSAFAERFRNVIGRSPADYVAQVRIDAAKRMLDAGRSVSETSRELGYASDEGFSRAFRRRTGITPSSWRTASQMPPIPA